MSCSLPRLLAKEQPLFEALRVMIEGMDRGMGLGQRQLWKSKALGLKNSKKSSRDHVVPRANPIKPNMNRVWLWCLGFGHLIQSRSTFSAGDVGY
jgi:hypothetical protein